MSNYSKTTDFLAKDAASATVQGSLFDTEYNAIATAIATKTDKLASPNAGRLLYVDGDSVLKDSGSKAINVFKTVIGPQDISGVNKWTQELEGTVSGVDIIYTNVFGTDIYNELKIRLGTGGSLQTSGYMTDVTSLAVGAAMHKFSSSTDGFRFALVPYVLPDYAQGQNSYGVAHLRQLDGYRWVLYGSNYDEYDFSLSGSYEPVPTKYSGVVTLTGPLDIVGLGDNTSGLINSGNVTINYWRSA